MKTATLDTCRKDYNNGCWHPDLCHDIWSLLGDDARPDAPCLAFDIQHCLEGMQTEHHHRLDAWQQKQSRMNWPLFWRQLSAELHAGLNEEANIRIKHYLGKKLSVLQQVSLHRFPLALDFCSQTSHTLLSRWTAKKAANANQLLTRTQPLPAWLHARFHRRPAARSPARIAVVGNGPSLINAGGGPHIDSADLVIRFNHVHTGDEFKADAGQGTDLWTVSPGMHLQRSSLVCPNICLSGPAPLMRSSRYWQRLAALPVKSVSTIPLESWYTLVRKLQAPPSAGLLVLDSLIRQPGKLIVEVHGFTAASAAAIIQKDQGSHYGDERIASERHNWQQEANMIRAWLDAGVIVNWQA